MTNNRRVAKESLTREIAPVDFTCEAASPQPGDLIPAELDDATTAYVLAMRAPFDLLRQSISQLAGLMVLAAAGASSGAHQPMLERAVEARAEAEEAIRSASAPPRAAHHHRHLLRADRALAAALKASGRAIYKRDDGALDAIIVPLRAAHTEMQHAAAALPGFEIVALSQACCARPAAHQAGISP
jgi:hypothetical protein